MSGFTALQLRNYRSGERPNPIMAAVAKPLNDAQVEAVGACYASLQPYQHDADFKNPYAWVMKAVVENWSDEDLKAVAAYVSGLRAGH